MERGDHGRACRYCDGCELLKATDSFGYGSVIEIGMEATTNRPAWKTLLAFAIIYFVWGSTFLAIRIGVHEVPPLLFAAMRFLVAGLALYGVMIARGERSPSGREWMSACMLALLIFVVDYGLLFWAEQRVPSGAAAVMMATIPVFIALSEIL